MRALDVITGLPPEVLELGQVFSAAGHELALVGGPVRDAFLGRASADLDFTTSARPDETIALLKEWGDAHWDIGKEFGTIGAKRFARAGRGSGTEIVVEVTTYRADEYDPTSRKPVVTFGDTLEGDLSRRDFTVNAMALRLPQLEFVDPHDGLVDLAAGLLRTPIAPEMSFDDDPLRMMRAARFAAQLGFGIEPATRQAIVDMADRMSIVSAERVRAELDKLLLSASPRAGLEVLTDTGLARARAARAHAHEGDGRRARSAQGRLPAHAHRDAAGDRPRDRPRGPRPRPGPGAAPRGRAARLRQARDAPLRAGRRRELPPPRAGRREARAQAAQGAALRQGHDQGRRPPRRAAPALPRVRRRRLDRFRGAPLRDGRRAPARALAPPHPCRLHDPQPPSGAAPVGRVRLARGAHRRAGRAGGDRVDPP